MYDRRYYVYMIKKNRDSVEDLMVTIVYDCLRLDQKLEFAHYYSNNNCLPLDTYILIVIDNIFVV